VTQVTEHLRHLEKKKKRITFQSQQKRMRLSWEIEPAGFFTPPQFEEDYRTQLKGFLSMGEFDGVLSSVNRLLRRSGSGTCNVGCFLGCCCCCFAVMRRNNRKALEDARWVHLLPSTQRSRAAAAAAAAAVLCSQLIKTPGVGV